MKSQQSYDVSFVDSMEFQSPSDLIIQFYCSFDGMLKFGTTFYLEDLLGS